MRTKPREVDLEETLKALGLGAKNVRRTSSGAVILEFEPGTPAGHQTQAQNIADNWDFTPNIEEKRILKNNERLEWDNNLVGKAIIPVVSKVKAVSGSYIALSVTGITQGGNITGISRGQESILFLSGNNKLILKLSANGDLSIKAEGNWNYSVRLNLLMIRG